MTAKIFSGRLLATILATFLFIGCSQDEPKDFETCFDNIKNQDESGVDCGGICPFQCPASMSAKVNGNAWKADSIKATFVSGSSLNIRGYLASGYYPSIQLVYIGSLTPGSHALSNGTSYTTDINAIVTFISGTITFNNVDSHDRILKGSFNFTCSDQSGTNYVISDGVFEDVPY